MINSKRNATEIETDLSIRVWSITKLHWGGGPRLRPLHQALGEGGIGK
jgi:hypothetical protein